jgi:hypothetical protein
MSEKLTISYCYNLTKPDSKRIELGVLTLDGDDFARFDWFVDPDGPLGLNPYCLEMVKSIPQIMRVSIQHWPAYKNRSLPAALKEGDPKNLVEYLCMCYSRSSYYVSRIETV